MSQQTHAGIDYSKVDEILTKIEEDLKAVKV